MEISKTFKMKDEVRQGTPMLGDAPRGLPDVRCFHLWPGGPTLLLVHGQQNQALQLDILLGGVLHLANKVSPPTIQLQNLQVMTTTTLAMSQKNGSHRF